MTKNIPAYDFDLFSDEGILNPYEHYAKMRKLGPVVYLPETKCYAITRFEECYIALRNSDKFISGRGVSFNPLMNDTPEMTDSVITSDAEKHKFLRKIESEPLAPKALSLLRERILEAAKGLIDDLAEREGELHDGVRDIACYLPFNIVMELGGLPPVGRAQMLRWAAAAFDLLGPMNARAQAALPVVQELLTYVTKDIDRNTITPGSWADRAFRLADEGVITQERAGKVIADFIAPSLDTTIAATSNLLMLLGQNRDQWELLKKNRSKTANAINESLRLGSPARCFSRFVPEETTLDGVTLPANSRVAIFFASANRDERKFENPDLFDINRSNASEHLAFGTGAHQCMGNNLARLEMTAILTSLLDRIDYFEVGEPVYALSNLLRTLETLPIRLHAKG
ncbi:MAG: cytochrome P450 [Emcibacter sp.]|nr:cytochrome P450 [Emcibacter sp.]